MGWRLIKRLFDVLFSLLGLILLSPVFAIIAILVRAFIGSPVFFKQDRPGLRGVVFKLIKFRTMADRFDSSGNLLADDLRICWFGQILRSTSLDEIPELWNVLKGEMSLVGPRPLLVEYMALYSEEQQRRHNVRPGITGWAQVNGRNEISWEEKFQLDIWYIENKSLWLDIKIVWMTLKKVLAREGVSAHGQVSMPKFTGYKKQ